MKKLILLIAILLTALSVHGKDKHYTVVVSLDGCRWDYPQLFPMPFADYMAAKGVESGLIPSFPSKTFPNHYTLATGLYPDHHGIVANSFFDTQTQETFSLASAEQKLNPRYYGGEPIWLTAQRQGLHTAVFYWPGSDVKGNNAHPDKFYMYDTQPRLTLQARIDGIVAELKKPTNQRPDLIMAYMEEPDASGHRYGPQAWQTRKAAMQVDSLLAALYKQILQLPIGRQVNLIVVSDHGMTWISKEHVVPIMPHLKKSWIKAIEGNIPANIYAADGCRDSIYTALAQIDHIKKWRKEDIPAYLHYGSNSRVGDIVVMPDIGYVVYEDPIEAGGQHGFDPTLSDMHALFRAIGPDFRHTSLPHFRNVDVYELLCHLLSIAPAANDGSLDEIKQMLYK